MDILVAFLRGVNMAGHNKIKMTQLTSLFNRLDFKDVVTYIQSGNVIFRTHGSALSIASRIEKSISEEFNYDIPVMIRTSGEIKALGYRNPFLRESNLNPGKSAVIFLYNEPEPDLLPKLDGIDYSPDEFSISGREIFIYCPNGFGRSKIYTSFFEEKLKVIGTGRNWKTINAISGIMDGL